MGSSYVNTTMIYVKESALEKKCIVSMLLIN